jgi:hypothetical protein
MRRWELVVREKLIAHTLMEKLLEIREAMSRDEAIALGTREKAHAVARFVRSCI